VDADSDHPEVAMTLPATRAHTEHYGGLTLDSDGVLRCVAATHGGDKIVVADIAALLAVAEAAEALLAEGITYREDVTTPECSFQSGPYCGRHSFLEHSPLLDALRLALEAS
jgi:hypothetical protein